MISEGVMMLKIQLCVTVINYILKCNNKKQLFEMIIIFYECF